MNKSLSSQLSAPFKPDQIEWRIAQSGKKSDGTVWAKCLAYVANRAVMDRLDGVFGPLGWKIEYSTLGGSGLQASGIIATISVRSDSGEWISKSDGAEQTDIESFKGGLSSAMKRAAVQWSIGRYLYDLEEGWAETSLERLPGWRVGKTKDGIQFFWNPPALPDWALPQKEGAPAAPTTQSAPSEGKAAAPTRARVPQAKQIIDHISKNGPGSKEAGLTQVFSGGSDHGFSMD